MPESSRSTAPVRSLATRSKCSWSARAESPTDRVPAMWRIEWGPFSSSVIFMGRAPRRPAPRGPAGRARCPWRSPRPRPRRRPARRNGRADRTAPRGGPPPRASRPPRGGGSRGSPGCPRGTRGARRPRFRLPAGGRPAPSPRGRWRRPGRGPGRPRTPRPARPTRRRRTGTGRRAAAPPWASGGLLLLDEVAEGVDGGEGAHADLLVFDLDVKFLLEAEDQLQRVDRVEAQSLSEEGRRVVDGRRVDLELQPPHDQILDARREVLPGHRAPSAGIIDVGRAPNGPSRHSSVGAPDLSGHVGGAVRGEEPDHRGDFLDA